MKLLVTGGCGFIGSNFIRHVLRVARRRRLDRQPGQADLRGQSREPRRRRAPAQLPLRAGRHRRPGRRRPWRWRAATRSCNFAAETHVDRSLLGDASFIETDVRGVVRPARGGAAARACASSSRSRPTRSTAAIAEGSFTEESAAEPAQPLRRVQGRRRPPRLLLLGVLRDAGRHHARLQQLRPVPVPGEADPALRRPTPSTTCRCRSTATGRTSATGSSSGPLPRRSTSCSTRAQPGETYNVARRQRGGEHRRSRAACSAELGKPESLIRFVDDRPGHDRRYSLDASKLARLGFRPSTPFDEGLSETVRWYRDHEEWWRPIKERDAAYREFYRTQYEQRLATSSATAKTAGIAAASNGGCARPLLRHATRASSRSPARRRARGAGCSSPAPPGCSAPTSAPLLAAAGYEVFARPKSDLDIADEKAVARALRELAARRRRQLRGVHEGRRLRDGSARLRGEREGRRISGRRVRPRRRPSSSRSRPTSCSTAKSARPTREDDPRARCRPTAGPSSAAKRRLCACRAASSCARRGSSGGPAGTSSRRS